MRNRSVTIIAISKNMVRNKPSARARLCALGSGVLPRFEIVLNIRLSNIL